MQNFEALADSKKSKQEAIAERLAFDLADIFGINLTQLEFVKKRLTGWPLYEYVVDAMVNGDACEDSKGVKINRKL